MNCEILETLYMKSNGEILCNDDFGERVVLGHVATSAEDHNLANHPKSEHFSASSLFSNRNYRQIETRLANGEIPWPGVCEKCAFFRPQETYSNRLQEKRIKKFQVEPSLACNLACPCCSNGLQIRTRQKPFIMPLGTFTTVLSSLATEHYQLASIEYCGQGEPLMHPNFPSFVTEARNYFPNAIQRLITNGNFEYQKSTGQQFIDEIYVSCDGVYQGSYEQYRVRGEVATALRFMSEVPKLCQGQRQKLIWKYILFEFNDSEEELIEAQRLATEFGVDTLLFVLTHSEFHSQRYTLETISNLPIVAANVQTNAHPSFYDGAKLGQSCTKNKAQQLVGLLPKTYRACLDEVNVFPNNIISIRGWAAGKTKIDSVRVYLDDKYLGTTCPKEVRDDVQRAFSNFPKQSPGFRFSTRVAEGIKGQASIRLDLYASEHKVRSVRQEFRFA